MYYARIRSRAINTVLHLDGANIRYSGCFQDINRFFILFPHDMSAILGVTLPRTDLCVSSLRYMRCKKAEFPFTGCRYCVCSYAPATRKGFEHVITIAGDVDLPQVIVVVQHGLGPRKTAHPVLGGQALLKGS